MSHHCKRFEGKSVIITAATAGIGLGIAQRLGEEGAKLTICSRKQVHWTSAALCLQASIGLIYTCVTGTVFHIQWCSPQCEQ